MSRHATATATPAPASSAAALKLSTCKAARGTFRMIGARHVYVLTSHYASANSRTPDHFVAAVKARNSGRIITTTKVTTRADASTWLTSQARTHGDL